MAPYFWETISTKAKWMPWVWEGRDDLCTEVLVVLVNYRNPIYYVDN